MILHVDMDAFYASVEQRERPELRGKPVIVGGSPEGRGVVAAASYEARKFGVHSAMPVRQALQCCPKAIVVRVRMQLYASVSKQIREIFQRYTPEIEPLSLDEAFLDVSGSEQLFGTAELIGRRIKADIREELGLVASVGVAPNKFLAKLASDLEKPDGFTVIPSDRIEATLAPLPVRRLWGVGKITETKLAAARLHTFGDLQKLDRHHAQALLGNLGEHFWKLARGIDDRRVVTDREAKTISHESTFSADVADHDVLRARLLELTEQVATRLRASGRVGRTVQVKIRYSDFHTISRAQSRLSATNSTEALWQVASELLDKQLPLRRVIVRLLGMGVSNLERTKDRQLSLFEDAEQSETQQRLDRSADEIRKLFGSAAIRRGSTLSPKHFPKT